MKMSHIEQITYIPTFKVKVKNEKEANALIRKTRYIGKINDLEERKSVLMANSYRIEKEIIKIDEELRTLKWLSQN